MKKGICICAMTTALIAIHAIMIKRMVYLEQACGVLRKCETYDC